jgi:hypothetical protein
MKEDSVFSKGKSFAEYIVRYARQNSGGKIQQRTGTALQ